MKGKIWFLGRWGHEPGYYFGQNHADIEFWLYYCFLCALSCCLVSMIVCIRSFYMPLGIVVYSSWRHYGENYRITQMHLIRILEVWICLRRVASYGMELIYVHRLEIWCRLQFRFYSSVRILSRKDARTSCKRNISILHVEERTHLIIKRNKYIQMQDTAIAVEV